MSGTVQFQLIGKRLRHRKPFVTQGREGAGGAAELDDKQPRGDLIQPPPVPHQWRQPGSDFHAKCNRQSLLTVSAPSEHGQRDVFRQFAQALGDSSKAALEGSNHGAHLEHARRIHDVLRRRPPVNKRRRIGAGLLTQFLYQSNDREPGADRSFAQRRNVDLIGPRGGDLLRCLRRNYAEPGFGLRQGDFDFDQRLNVRRVGEK